MSNPSEPNAHPKRIGAANSGSLHAKIFCPDWIGQLGRDGRSCDDKL
jgi:hypothetical protein